MSIKILPSDIEIFRVVFEETISSPPFELSIKRYGNESAWPGNYKRRDVNLAFDVFLDSVFTLIENKNKIRSLN